MPPPIEPLHAFEVNVSLLHCQQPHPDLQPAEGTVDRKRIPGSLVVIAKKLAVGVTAQGAPGEFDGPFAEVDDARPLLALAFVQREDPTRVREIDVASLDGECLLRTAAGLPGDL